MLATKKNSGKSMSYVYLYGVGCYVCILLYIKTVIFSMSVLHSQISGTENV